MIFRQSFQIFRRSGTRSHNICDLEDGHSLNSNSTPESPERLKSVQIEDCQSSRKTPDVFPADVGDVVKTFVEDYRNKSDENEALKTTMVMIDGMSKRLNCSLLTLFQFRRI